MDDTKTLSIPVGDGIKLRARPLTEGQLLSLTMLKGADLRLQLETMNTLFRSVFGEDTHREFILRLAAGGEGADGVPGQMTDLLTKVADATMQAMKAKLEAAEAKPEPIPDTFRGEA